MTDLLAKLQAPQKACNSTLQVPTEYLQDRLAPLVDKVEKFLNTIRKQAVKDFDEKILPKIESEIREKVANKVGDEKETVDAVLSLYIKRMRAEAIELHPTITTFLSDALPEYETVRKITALTNTAEDCAIFSEGPLKSAPYVTLTADDADTISSALNKITSIDEALGYIKKGL